MADRLAAGQLEPILRRLRETVGVSYAAIARLLEDQYGIVVHEHTVRAWCLDLGIGRRTSEAAS